jgi:hypothetical protein
MAQVKISLIFLAPEFAGHPAIFVPNTIGSVPDRIEWGVVRFKRHNPKRCYNPCDQRNHDNQSRPLPEGQTLLMPSFAAGEGLSPAGMSGAQFVSNGITGNAATTNAISVITRTSSGRCPRDRPC